MREEIIVGAIVALNLVYAVYIVRDVWRKYVGHH
jgi:hypothetical protein